MLPRDSRPGFGAEAANLRLIQEGQDTRSTAGEVGRHSLDR
jgi:hypothetical protein